MYIVTNPLLTHLKKPNLSTEVDSQMRPEVIFSPNVLVKGIAQEEKIAGISCDGENSAFPYQFDAGG